MKTFTAFWLDGTSEVLKGNSINDALINAGYSLGATQALDFWAAGDLRDRWHWDNIQLTWKVNI